MNASAYRFSAARSSQRGFALLRTGGLATVAALVIGASAVGWQPTLGGAEVSGLIDPMFEPVAAPAPAADEATATAPAPAAAPAEQPIRGVAPDAPDDSTTIWSGQSAG